MLFAGLDAGLTGCERFDLLKGPPGGVGFAAAGAEFDFGRAPGFDDGLGVAADLAGVDGDLEAETAFEVGKVAAAAAVAFDDAGAEAGAWADGFAMALVAGFDNALGVGAGAAAISFLAGTAPISFFFFTTLPPPRIGKGILTAVFPPTPSSPKGLFAVGILGPGAFV